MLDPAFEALLKGDDAPALGRLEPVAERQAYRDLSRRFDGTAPADVTTRDLEVAGGAGTIGARLYTPPGHVAPGGLLVYIHGGGFVIGDLETHDGLCRRLSKLSGAQVLAIDYRLAPEHPFPAAHDDAVAAVEWAFENAAELGVDPRRIAVGGDSAGGNLSAATAITLRDRARHRLAFQLLLYPAVGAGDTASLRALSEGYFLDSTALTYFNSHLGFAGHPEFLRLAPAATADLSGLPPAAIVTAGFDPLKDDGAIYAERLRDAGVQAELTEHPTLLHGFFTMAGVSPAVEAAIEAAAASLRRALR